MHKDLDLYFNHPLVIQTYRKHLLLAKDQERPYLNYFGINFDQDGISSVKFYFPFFKKLKKEQVELFLPKTEDFFRYYHLWNETNFKSLEHSGCTFEIKFKKKLTPILGFHYRLSPIKESYDLIGFPNSLPLNLLELDTRPGINYEYSKDEVLRKKYYYFHSPKHKEYFAKRFNNSFISKVNLIEYTEADTFSKINAWRFDHTKENLNRPNVHTDYANSIFNFLKEKYNLFNLSDGYYENGEIHASYFFNTIHSSDTPFDDLINYNIDTLKLLY